MFRLENPYYLYGLIIIPILILLFIMVLYWKKRSLLRFSDKKFMGILVPAYSSGKLIVKFILLLIAFLFLVIGLTNPQIGSKLIKVERKGIDIMILLDVSNSMLAEDVQPNRLGKAKQSISKMIDKLGNDRIGIIVFAGKAYTQLPITSDHSAAKLFLSTINTNIVPTQGTSIGTAIEMAGGSFGESDHSKAIIVITDGEDHEGDAIQAAQLVAKKDIKVYTIGMGLPGGSPIPEYRNGRVVGYKKDKDGSTVVTKLNEKTLQQIASAGNGEYVGRNNTSVLLGRIIDQISQLEKTEFDSKLFSDYEDRFQYFIAISIIFLLIEMFIIERKSKWIERFRLFKKET